MNKQNTNKRQTHRITVLGKSLLLSKWWKQNSLQKTPTNQTKPLEFKLIYFQNKKIIRIKNQFLAYNFEKFQGLDFCLDDGTHFHPRNGQYHGIEDDCHHFLIDQNRRLLSLQKLS